MQNTGRCARMTSNGLSKAAGLLAVPETFIQTAMAFPKQVDQALALLDQSPDPIGDAIDMHSRANAMEHYANRIKVDNRVIKPIQYGKLKIEAKLGQLHSKPSPSEAGKRGGRGKKGGEGTDTLFHRDTIAKFRKVADHAPSIDTYYQDVLADDEVEMSTAGFIRYVASDGNLKSHQNKGVVEWYTPADYVEAARTVMGSIDLDPASNSKAQKVVQAGTFYSKSDDGLSKTWSGNVFLNPPFKAELATAFVAKLCESHKSGDVPQAILLTNNNTDTAWWHQAAKASAAVCFTLGRIAFYSPAGDSAKPTNGHTLFYFGSRWKQFANVFGERGLIMRS